MARAPFADCAGGHGLAQSLERRRPAGVGDAGGGGALPSQRARRPRDARFWTCRQARAVRIGKAAAVIAPVLLAGGLFFVALKLGDPGRALGAIGALPFSVLAAALGL